MEGLRKIGRAADEQNETALLDALAALRARDFATVQRLVKWTAPDMMFSAPRLRFVGGRAGKHNKATSSNLFVTACKMGHDCSWDDKDLRP
jgi:hypothetical protein